MSVLLRIKSGMVSGSVAVLLIGMGCTSFACDTGSCNRPAEEPELTFRGIERPGVSAIDESSQIILVRAKDWVSQKGLAQRFARERGEAKWTALGSTFLVTLGKNGLGRGRGVHEEMRDGGPVKKEGDGKAPAGMFRLGAAFGYAPPDEPVTRSIALQYVQLTKGVECVDDVKSIAYNQIVHSTDVATPDWTSSEQLLRKDDLYRWGVVVEHNAKNVVPGAGSCIFMHVWRSETSPTVGGTAMEMRQMEEVVRWLEPQANPLLVQLPEDVYQEVRSLWKLP